jgi:hypothetical protein
MIKIYIKVISLFLMMAFLLPSIVKFEHHHSHFEFKDSSEKQIHEFHEKCTICNFEFAVFLSDINNIELLKENPTDCYFNNYSSYYRYSLSLYSFLLRAPPRDKLGLQHS